MRDFLLVAAEPDSSAGALFQSVGDSLKPGGVSRHEHRLLHGFATGSRIAFDGIAVFGRDLVQTSEQASTATGPGIGNYVLARCHGAGDVSIEIDPLGYYPLFVYHRDGLFCVGNRSALIVDVLERLGRSLPRHPAVHAWFTLQGSGAFDLSGYEGLSLLARGTSLHLDGRNRVSYRTRSDFDLFYSSRPLNELIDDAAHEILASVDALSRAPFDFRVCDLTGGMDSRLVVSALIHQGAQDAFVFYTKGQHPNPDANVAALIRARFGLRRAVNVFPAKAAPLSPLDRLRSSVAEVDGLLSTYFQASPGSAEQSRQLSIGGGSGELLREFWRSGDAGAWPSALRPSRWWLPWRNWAAGAQPVSLLHDKMQSMKARSGFLRDDIRRDALTSVAQFAEDARSQGIRPQHVGDLFYLSSRARYHFGVWWAHSARTRFHPLYSPAALKAAHAMENSEKAANRLGFELMRRFCPELVDIPFAEKAWKPGVLPTAPAPITRRSPYLGASDEKAVSVYPERKGGGRRNRTDHERKLIATGQKQRVVDFGGMLREFDPAAQDYAALEPAFRIDAVRKFLDRPPEAFTGRYDVDNAYRLIGAHVWANRLEIPSRR